MYFIENNNFLINHTSYNNFNISNEKNDIEKINILFDSLVKTQLLFPGIIENKQLSFKAVSIEYLTKTHIKTEHDYINLMESISSQLFYLEKKGYTFYGFDLKDIIIIDKNIFIILNTSYLKKINKDTLSLQFTSPFKKPFFSSPEIVSITSIPSQISYKSIYYSIGSLIVYLRFNQNLLFDNKVTTENEIEETIEAIKYTRLYWFLKRCFEKNIDDRYLLYI